MTVYSLPWKLWLVLLAENQYQQVTSTVTNCQNFQTY